MRYSSYKKTDLIKVTAKTAGGRRSRSGTPGLKDLCKDLEACTDKDTRVGAILLVGGMTPGDLAVRAAQSVQRFDRRASPWSHAAIITSWSDGATLGRIRGRQVSLGNSAFTPKGMLPESNGVEDFRLSDYDDEEFFPNVAIGVIEKEPALAKRIKAALKEPMRQVTRYPLYTWMGPWLNYVHTGENNPILDRVPLPGAALCEYAFAAAGMDLIPGATDPNASPELIWASLKHWQEAIASSVTKVHLAELRRDDHRATPGRE